MRLVVCSCDGHDSVYDVSTFDKLKVYCLVSVYEAYGSENGEYDELIKRLEAAQTEEDLMSDENMNAFDYMDECNPFQGRDIFTHLIDLESSYPSCKDRYERERQTRIEKEKLAVERKKLYAENEKAGELEKARQLLRVAGEL